MIGRAAMYLGAGRERVDSTINPAVGIIVHKKRGDRVGHGEVLTVIHCNDRSLIPELSSMIREAFILKNTRPRPRPLIRAIVTQTGNQTIQK
jgi:thymidine phosphorylase